MRASQRTKREREGMRHIISFSGGKDSTALVLWAIEQGLDFDTVFCDTGWEVQSIYDYIKYVVDTFIMPGSLIVLKSDKYDGMADLCEKKGRAPSTMARFCTEELKVKPMIEYVNSIEGEKIVYQGIRAEESPRRAAMQQNGFSEIYNCEVRRPLFHWTHQDVFSIHQKHNCKINPLYMKGFARVGCMPCIMARHGEMRQIIKQYPERIDAIREIEKATGRTFFSAGYIPPTTCRSVDPKTGVKIAFIDNIVEYLQGDTAQEELFEIDDSCVSYYALCGI